MPVGSAIGRRAWLALPVVAVILGACAGAAPAGGGTGGNGPGGQPTGNGQTAGGMPDGHRASGAKVRVFNAYSPVTSAPGPVDVYLDPVIDSSSHPAVTVPYGTMSPLFDPTVVDDAGDTSLTFLPAGVTDQTKAVMTQQETVKSGDVITIYLTTGDKLDSGGYGGQDQVFFNTPSADVGLATAPPGKGLLIVVSSGLDQTLASPDARDWYVSLGKGCDPGLDGGDGTTVTVSPGSSGATFALEPGSVTVTIHAISPDSQPDCGGSPIASATVTAKPGVTDVLFLYGTEGALHAEMVPLE